MGGKEKDDAGEHPAWGKLAAIVLAGIGLFFAWRYTALSAYADPERVMEWARTVGDVRWSPLLLLLVYTPAALVMFPRPLLTVFAVVAYGPWLGFVTGLAGIGLSAFLLHWAGRALPDRTVRRLAGRKFERVTPVLRKHGLLASFAMSVAAIAPYPVEAMAAGAIRIRRWHYLLGTMMGMTPGTLLSTVLADEVETAIENPSEINFWLIGLGVLFIATLTLVVRRSLSKLEHDAAK
jgi:phospholipase D1/2